MQTAREVDLQCHRFRRAELEFFASIVDGCLKPQARVAGPLGPRVRVTALFTTLASEGQAEPAEQLIASLIDTVLLLRTLEGNGEHNRVLSVLKSRGMAHSNQVREFLLTDRGIELADVYVGPQGVLTGSARSAQEAKEQSDATGRQKDLQQRRDNLERERLSVEAQVANLWREFNDEAETVDQLLNRGATGREEGVEQRLEQGRLRNSDLPAPDESLDRHQVER